MAWAIEFIPNEVDAVTVDVNNEHWITWHSSDGHVTWPLAPKWRDLNKIHVYGAAVPRGKNASMKVRWDGRDRQDMDFDDDEDHDVSAA